MFYNVKCNIAEFTKCKVTLTSSLVNSVSQSIGLDAMIEVQEANQGVSLSIMLELT